jgi:hypothetical protein
VVAIEVSHDEGYAGPCCLGCPVLDLWLAKSITRIMIGGGEWKKGRQQRLNTNWPPVTPGKVRVLIMGMLACPLSVAQLLHMNAQ